MKCKFLFFCLLFYQCSPQDREDGDYKKFVFLKEESNKTSKIISCSVKPIDDVDLSHYTVYGFSFRENTGYGVLKIAREKNGQRLNYEIPLTPDKGVRLDRIYMTDAEKEKFHNGKACKFRILFEEAEEESQFIIKEGVLSRKDAGDKNDDIDEKNVNISIFVEHKIENKVHKASDEMVLH